ncbi:MAG: FecR family protein [Luteolibacter sp.]
MKLPSHLVSGLLGLSACTLSGAPLREGEFTRVINDVKILPVESSPLPAKPGDRITGRTAVSTGAQSRAEIRFADQTLTRLGANSVFRMDHATRTVEVEKGVILLQVPKQIGGAKVRTAAVTAAVTGTTVLLEFTPDGFVKIIVVEGEVDVSLNERRNQFRTLTAGDMWISRTNDKTGLPLPVQVDLERLKKTSKLLSDKEFPPLGNQKQMQGALEDQARKKADGELMDTAFVIDGRGRNVMYADTDRQHIRFLPIPPVTPPAAGPNPPAEEIVPPEGGKPVNIVGTTVFDNRSTIDASSGFNNATGSFTPLPATIYRPGIDGPFGAYMYDSPDAFPGLDALLAENEGWFVMKGDEFDITGGPTVGGESGTRNLIMGATGDFNFDGTSAVESPENIAGNLWTLGTNLTDVVFTSLSGSINFQSFNLGGTDQNVIFYADSLASDISLGGSPPSSVLLPTGTFETVAGRDISVGDILIETANIWMTAGQDLTLTQGAELIASDSVETFAGGDVFVSSALIQAPNILLAAGTDLQLQKGSKIIASELFDTFADRDLVFGSTSVEAENILMSAGVDLRIDKGERLAAAELMEASAGQDIQITASALEAKDVDMSAGRNLKLDRSARVAAADTITLRAKAAVTISNSSELRRLSQLDNPKLLIEAGDGNAELLAKASVDMDAVDISSRRGDVQIINSAIAAREIKGRVFDSGGTLLLNNATLGRGANSADLIRLYGEGANGVRFQGDTTLRGNVVQIAGQNVTIDSGARVRLSNPSGTTVFSNSHQFNNGSNGNFTGLDSTTPADVNKQSFGSRPGY